MLLFWKLIDEKQMGNPCDHAARDIFSILPPLRAVYFRPFLYETPCTNRPTIPHTTSKIILPHFVNKDWSEKLITSLNWSCGTALGLLPSTIDRNPMPKAKSFNFSAKNLIGFSHFFRIFFFILFHFFLSLKFLLTGSLIIAFIVWHINFKIEWKYNTYVLFLIWQIRIWGNFG